MKADVTMMTVNTVTRFGDPMTGSSNEVPPIPRETARNARAVFSSDNFYIQVGEQLEFIVKEVELKYLSLNGTGETIFPLVTFFQAMEGLIDPQAMDAIRSRIDWKFALHLPVQAPVFHACALCQFRSEVMSDPLRQFYFQKLIDRLCQLKPSGRDNLEGSRCLHVLEVVEAINRIGHLREAIHQALEVLALHDPEWLQKIALPHWYGRYNNVPQGYFSARRLAQERFSTKEICDDIDYLLEQIGHSGPAGINDLNEINALNQVWLQESQRSSRVIDENETLGFHNCDSCPRSATRRQRD